MKSEAEVLPVVSDGGELLGYLKLSGVLSLDVSNPSIPVEALPLRRPLVVRATDPIGEVVERMVKECESQAFVTDISGKLVGVVSAKRIVERLLLDILFEGREKGLSRG